MIGSTASTRDALLSAAGHELGVKHLERCRKTSSTKRGGVAADLQDLVDASKAR